MDKKLNNLLDFDDFEKSWKAKDQKSTKRTDVGLDIVEENVNEKKKASPAQLAARAKFIEMIKSKKKGKEGKEEVEEKPKKKKKGCKCKS